MATYESLTPQQKADLADGLRSVCGLLRRISAEYNAHQWPNLATYWAATVQPLLDSLDPGESVPNPTDLAGTGDLPKAHVNALWTFVETQVYGTMDANRAALVNAIGINVAE